MVSAAIISVLAGMLFSVFSSGSAAYYSDMGYLDAQQQLRQAMDVITREIRQSKAEDAIISDAGGRVEFTIPVDLSMYPPAYSRSISYYRDTDNRLIREHPAGAQKVVAHNVTELSFACCGAGGCGFDCSHALLFEVACRTGVLAAHRNATLSSKERIAFRNEDK